MAIADISRRARETLRKAATSGDSNARSYADAVVTASVYALRGYLSGFFRRGRIKGEIFQVGRSENFWP